MYDLCIRQEVDKTFEKLAKKNPHQFKIIDKTIRDIREKPLRKYKFLRAPLQNYNSVHIDSHFILIFQIHHDRKEVEVFHYEHHDNAYYWRPSRK